MKSYEATGEAHFARVYYDTEDFDSVEVLREVAAYIEATGEFFHSLTFHGDSWTAILSRAPESNPTDTEARLIATAAVRYVDAFKAAPTVTTEWQTLRDLVGQYKG